MQTIYETIYRPPLEAGSSLLELSVGCSWGRCAFCRLADGHIPLQLVPESILRQNLLEKSLNGEMPERMFLTGENALSFKTDYLLRVFSLVRAYLPTVRQFAMFGRAVDVETKSDSQLEQLKNAGLATVYVGLESGNSETLRLVAKGVTPETMYRQLRRLDQVGIDYGLSAIFGLGGEDLSAGHARDTAGFINSVRPQSVRFMTLTIMPGTPLARMAEQGKFRQLSPQAALAEERSLINALEPGEGGYRLWANHVSNSLPLAGNLPEEKERLLKALDAALENGLGDCARNGGW